MGKRVADAADKRDEQEEVLVVEERARSSRTGRTPRGHFVVYVGTQMKRFVVPTSLLKNAAFLRLFDMAEEEYGFGDHRPDNRILLPCDEAAFQALLASITSHTT